MPNPVYGCVSTLVSDTKLLIAGGWSEERGKSSKVYTINLSNGNIEYLDDLKVPGWTVLPPFYSNSTLNIFFQGEETDGLPTQISYFLKTPLY